jgi:excisionase family DNA binding protein
MDETRFVTIDEFARHVRRSRSAVYVAIKRGEIPTVRVGAVLRIPTAYLKKLERDAQRALEQ